MSRTLIAGAISLFLAWSPTGGLVAQEVKPPVADSTGDLQAETSGSDPSTSSDRGSPAPNASSEARSQEHTASQAASAKAEADQACALLLDRYRTLVADGEDPTYVRQALDSRQCDLSGIGTAVLQRELEAARARIIALEASISTLTARATEAEALCPANKDQPEPALCPSLQSDLEAAQAEAEAEANRAAELEAQVVLLKQQKDGMDGRLQTVDQAFTAVETALQDHLRSRLTDKGGGLFCGEPELAVDISAEGSVRVRIRADAIGGGEPGEREAAVKAAFSPFDVNLALTESRYPGCVAALGDNVVLLDAGGEKLKPVSFAVASRIIDDLPRSNACSDIGAVLSQDARFAVFVDDNPGKPKGFWLRSGDSVVLCRRNLSREWEVESFPSRRNEPRILVLEREAG